MLNLIKQRQTRQEEYQLFDSLLETRRNDLNQRIEAQMMAEIAWLKEQAEMIINDHRILAYQIKQSKSMAEWGILEVKLRENKYSFSIDWYLNQFIKINGQWRKFSKPLKMNKTTLNYTFKQAKKAKSWEIEHAILIEPKFAMIRKKMQKLIALKRYI